MRTESDEKMEKNEDKESEAKKLANRLSDRMKKKATGSKPSRLGDRLSKRKKGGKKETTTSKDTKADIPVDFFEEFERLAENHPELKNVKMSELKKVISRIGMTHPEEVAEALRGEEFRSEVRKKKENWVTH